MKIAVGTTPVPLEFAGNQTPIVQNLGPGILYLDRTSEVTAGTGMRVAVGDAYEFPADLGASGSSVVYLVSDTADTDVRYMVAD